MTATHAGSASRADLIPNHALISTDAITANARALREGLAEHTALMAVVKADGYGHGMVAAARAALAGGATWLGVAHPADALELVRAGLDVPILAWLYEPVTARAVVPDLVEAGGDIAVSSLEQCALVAESAKERGVRARVHIKLDSGMGRGGALEADVAAIARMIRENQSLHLAGAMSHFHSADALGDPSIDAQAARFDALCARIEEVAGPIPLRHMGNTAIAQSRPDLHYDMVRVGIGLYGYPAAGPNPALRPAMTLASRVALVKQVEAGQSVGYGALFTAAESTTLGLVPFGYADGLSRDLTGKITVVVRSASGDVTVPVVGRISMDQIVLDLGPDSAVQPGDEVVILGDPEYVPGAMTAADHAALLGTISYEILTSVSSRVVRVPASAPSAASDALTFRRATRGAEDTRVAAEAIAGLAAAGDLFVLDGPLGAGKTTFTQGFARAFDVRGTVASPTFVIARVHPNQADGPDLVHVDAYRLDEDWDIEDLDLDSDMDASITLVEWGRERVEHLASSYGIVELHRAEELDPDADPDETDEARSVSVTFVGDRFEAEREAITAALAAAGFETVEEN